MKNFGLLFALLISPSAFSDVILCTGMSNAQDQCFDWRKNNTTGHKIINAAWPAHDYYRLNLPGKLDSFWRRAEKILSRHKLTLDDVDIVYNYNTLSDSRITKGVSTDYFGAEGFIWAEYMKRFQEEVEANLPNLKAGYHAINEPRLWCDWSSGELAGQGYPLVVSAIQDYDKWHVGPDLSELAYVRSDYVANGCHPATAGLAKTTPIINDFFGGDAPEPTENPEPGTPGGKPPSPPPANPPKPVPNYPELAVSYQPDFPKLGQYTLGACSVEEVGSTVTLQDNERLQDAWSRLQAISPNYGTIAIPHDVDTVQCDTLRMKDKTGIEGTVFIKGLPGPQGEQPRFYCRSETRDGTVPRDEVEGGLITILGYFPGTVVIENIHSDGYRKSIALPVKGHVVLRNNYLHHGLNNGIVNSNNSSEEGGLTVELCGNEISHFGQGNAIHNSYIHASLGGAGDTGLDGNPSWNKLVYVDNLCHSSRDSHCLKSIANENIVQGNRFYNTLDTDPSYTQLIGSTLVDISACTLTTIKDNYFYFEKPYANHHGKQIVGIRNRRTKFRGCDKPVAWDFKIPPNKIDGPVHTEKYWEALNGEIQFPTQVSGNTFEVAGEFGHKVKAIHMYGTYPNHETTLGGPSCWLPTPMAWYERARVYASDNSFTGFKAGFDARYENRYVPHSSAAKCAEPYNNRDSGLKPPGPGPELNMIEVQ